MQAVILTLSAKNKGICLAVYYPKNNKLYRLVSDEKGGELPISLKNCFNLLDIIEFKVVGFPKNGPQVDNIQIDINEDIKKIGKYDGNIESTYNLVNRNNNGKIFGSTFSTLTKADFFKHSLELVKVSNLKIIKHLKPNNTLTGKAEFTCDNLQHSSYAVTDLDYDIRNKNFDCWNIGDAFLVISIPKEPYIVDGENKGYYKFISAIYKQ